MNNLVKIRLHGLLGKKIGREFNLAVNSVAEAIRAIDVLTGNAWQRLLTTHARNNLNLDIVINGKKMKVPPALRNIKNTDPVNEKMIHKVKNSELYIKNNDLKTIDITPAIEGSATLVAMIIVAIVVAVITYLLMKPPKFEDFRAFDEAPQKSRQSYLFGGPQNTVNEGGPVPLGYGRLVVGSQTIAQVYSIGYKDAGDSTITE